MGTAKIKVLDNWFIDFPHKVLKNNKTHQYPYCHVNNIDDDFLQFILIKISGTSALAVRQAFVFNTFDSMYNSRTIYYSTRHWWIFFQYLKNIFFDSRNTLRDGGSITLKTACTLFTTFILFTLITLFNCLHFVSSVSMYPYVFFKQWWEQKTPSVFNPGLSCTCWHPVVSGSHQFMLIRAQYKIHTHKKLTRYLFFPFCIIVSNCFKCDLLRQYHVEQKIHDFFLSCWKMLHS